MSLAPILIIDIEATCWKREPPPGQQSEIIEIGLCVYDPAANLPGEAVSLLVRPTRSEVSPFCTQLTTLTQEMVDAGMSFSEACDLLRTQYGARDRLWASWGEYDRGMFINQCMSFGLEYPFGSRHLNIKQLYAKLELNGKQVGMSRALGIARIPLEGTHHRGGDDARNIARLLTYLVGKYGPSILDP